MCEQNASRQAQLDSRILEVLKELVEHHSSSRFVAEKMGQAHNYVARILRGETKLRLDVLERILTTIGVTESFFFKLVCSSGSERELVDVLAFYGGDGPPPDQFVVDARQTIETLLTRPLVGSAESLWESPIGAAADPIRRRLEELEDLRQTDRPKARALLEELAGELLGRAHKDGLTPRDAAHLAEALVIWGAAMRFEGHRRDTSLACRLALNLAFAAGDSRAVGIALQKASYLMRDLACLKAGLVLLEHSMSHFLRAGDTVSCGRVLVDRGYLLLSLAEYPEVIRESQAALRLLPQEEWRNRASSFGNMAISYERLNQLQKAKSCFEQAETLYGDRREIGLAYIRWNRGSLALADQDAALAESCFLSSLNQLEDFGQPLDFAMVALNLAEAYMLQGKVGELRDLADRMLAWLPTIRGNRVADAALMEWIRCARWGEVTHQLLRDARKKLSQAAGNR